MNVTVPSGDRTFCFKNRETGNKNNFEWNFTYQYKQCWCIKQCVCPRLLLRSYLVDFLNKYTYMYKSRKRIESNIFLGYLLSRVPSLYTKNIYSSKNTFFRRFAMGNTDILIYSGFLGTPRTISQIKHQFMSVQCNVKSRGPFFSRVLNLKR